MNRRDFMAASLLPGERFELPTNGLQNLPIDACLRVGASQTLLFGQKRA
jgi:hypothetical protein